jgi:hypothetical protein
MKASSLTIIESLQERLFEFPALVDGLKNKDHNILDLLEAWMKEVENFCRQNKISEAAAIAGYRSKVIAPTFAEPQKRSAKKQQLQAAADAMFDLQNTVLTVIKPHEVKVQEARDLMNQLMGAIKQAGILIYHDGADFQGFVMNIWNICISTEQLKPGAARMLTLVPATDALRIIAEEIALDEWR